MLLLMVDHLSVWNPETLNTNFFAADWRTRSEFRRAVGWNSGISIPSSRWSGFTAAVHVIFHCRKRQAARYCPVACFCTRLFARSTLLAYVSVYFSRSRSFSIEYVKSNWIFKSSVNEDHEKSMWLHAWSKRLSRWHPLGLILQYFNKISEHLGVLFEKLHAQLL